MVVFELKMRSIGDPSGGELRVIMKDVRDSEKVGEIIEGSSYSYNWDDGLSATIVVYECSEEKAESLKSACSGFVGYEWMVESIINHGKIMTSREISEGGY